MEKIWFLPFLLLQIIPANAALGVGVGVGGGIGVGVGIGGGGGGVGSGGGGSDGGGGGGGGAVWIGGGGGGVNSRTPSQSSNAKPNAAYTALQTWKSSITDDPMGILSTWVGSNVCSYRGVFCVSPPEGEMYPSSGGPAVAGIDLNHANLQGSLVKELSLLSDLTLIHLNSNRFSGTIPDTFKDLSALTELDLSNNLLSGPFPSVTLLVPNLVYLDLRFNNFSGSIPEDIFNKNLDAIFLNNNQFEGQIPLNLGTSPASVINLANNKFRGNIPPSFGYMGPSLKEVLFLNNQLTGCVPEGVGLLSQMQVLDLSFNSLKGHLPDSISCLEEIEVLNFGHNKLSGVLPDLVCSLKSLINLTVSFNFFSGFSQECSKLPVRNVGFDFSGNCIPGRDMQRPQPECSVIPGGNLNCLRIPLTKPLVCDSISVSQNLLYAYGNPYSSEVLAPSIPAPSP